MTCYCRMIESPYNYAVCTPYYSYTVRRTQYDRLSQQQLGFLYFDTLRR